MGQLFSSFKGRRSAREEEPALTEQPWRATKRWSEEFRNELKSEILNCHPKTKGHLVIPYYNIALTGEIGAGKSSYYNSLYNIYQDHVAGATADVGRQAESLTKKYRVYDITPKDGDKALSLRVCDTMGLQSGKQNDASNILKAVNGHVPDRFEFSDDEINQDTPKYIARPELKDKAHSVAIVVNAAKLNQMTEDTKSKLKALRKQLGAPRTYILLTHIDEACVEVNKDVTKVYHSIAIRDLVNQVSTMLYGLPENHIFPIMNYKKQIYLDKDMDILLLQPLCHMLRNAQTFLDEEIDDQLTQGRLASRTHRGQPVMQPVH